MNSKSSSGNMMTIGIAGFILGGIGTAIYLVSHDEKKQENIKNVLSDAKNVSARTLDRLRERISQEAEQTEDELRDMRKNEDSLAVR